MKFSVAICFLVLLGAVCLAEGGSSKREKRMIFSKLFDKIDKVFDDVKDKVVDAVKYTGKVGRKVGTAVSDVTKDAIHKTDDLIHKTDDIIHDVVDKVKDVAVDTVKYTGKVGKKVGTGVVDVTKDFIHKTDDFVDDSVDFVVHVADDVKDGVVDAAKYTVKISKKVGKGVATISRNVYKATYNGARKAFDGIQELAGKVDFDEAVLVLISYIDSDASNALCQLGCVSAAAYVMGPVAGFIAEIACAPLCTAALAKLEDLAQDIAEDLMDDDN